MSDIFDAIRSHEADRHDGLLTRQEIEAMDTKALNLIEEMADELLGPRRTVLAGGGRVTERGMKHQTTDLIERQKKLIAWQAQVQKYFDNGGVPSKLSGKDRATILVAATSGAAAVIVGIIDYLIHL